MKNTVYILRATHPYTVRRAGLRMPTYLGTVTLAAVPPRPLQASGQLSLTGCPFYPRAETNNENRFSALPAHWRRLPSIDRIPPGPRVICKNSHGALVFLGMIRILLIPPPVNSALSSPWPSYVFCMLLRADRDLTPTHHVVLLSLPLSDPWFRPCTGNIPHPLHGQT